MKKSLLIPTLLTLSASPLISLVGCKGDNKDPEPFKSDCLCLTALEDLDFWIQYDEWESPIENPNVQYSVNGGDWQKYELIFTPHNDEGEYVHLSNGQKLYLKGNNPNGFSYDTTGLYSAEGRLFEFYVDGKIDVSGNIMSLIDDGQCKATEIPSPGCFEGLFNAKESTDGVVHADQLILPDNSVNKYCYCNMFSSNNLLVSTPKLNANVLETGCYECMFYYCESLTQAPELPAETLAEECYDRMFFGSGLKQTPELPVETLANGCYNQMFFGCTSLTQVSQLPATTLAERCYQAMFQDCSSLKIHPSIGTKFFTCPTIIPERAVDNMFTNTYGHPHEITPGPGSTYCWYEE